MARIDFVTGNARRYLPDVESLAAIPDRLERMLAGHSYADLRTSSDDDGQPTVLRVIGDMSGYARHDHHALHRMVWMTDPIVEPWDADAEATDEAWEARDSARLLGWLTETLTETVELLKDLPDASWGRPGLFPEAGRRSIRQQVRASVEHYRSQLDRLEASLGG